MSVNILGNDINVECANAFIEIMDSKASLKTLCGFSGNETELDLSQKDLTAGCAVLVANEVKKNGVLASLNMSNNMLASKASGKALAEMLSSNSVLKELDVSKNAQYPRLRMRSADGPGFANELAVGISANGAVTSLNVSMNSIPVKNMNAIIAIVEAKPAMKVLCTVPFRDKTITELNVSSQNLGVEGALVVSRYLVSNRALETITFGDKQAVTMKADMIEADFSGKQLDVSGAIIVAAFLPKCQ